MANVREILARWGSRQHLVDDTGVPYSTVSSWYSNNRVPAWHHASLLASAKKRGIALTPEELTRAHQPPSRDAGDALPEAC